MFEPRCCDISFGKFENSKNHYNKLRHCKRRYRRQLFYHGSLYIVTFLRELTLGE